MSGLSHIIYLILFINLDIFSPHSNFCNIRVHGLWKTQKIHKKGFSSTIMMDNFLTDLMRIYSMIYKNDGIILKRHVNYYDSIRFRILHGIDTYSDIVLRIGDPIDIEDTKDSEN